MTDLFVEEYPKLFDTILDGEKVTFQRISIDSAFYAAAIHRFLDYFPEADFESEKEKVESFLRTCLNKQKKQNRTSVSYVLAPKHLKSKFPLEVVPDLDQVVDQLDGAFNLFEVSFAGGDILIFSFLAYFKQTVEHTLERLLNIVEEFSYDLTKERNFVHLSSNELFSQAQEKNILVVGGTFKEYKGFVEGIVQEYDRVNTFRRSDYFNMPYIYPLNGKRTAFHQLNPIRRNPWLEIQRTVDELDNVYLIIFLTKISNNVYSHEEENVVYNRDNLMVVTWFWPQDDEEMAWELLDQKFPYGLFSMRYCIAAQNLQAEKLRKLTIFTDIQEQLDKVTIIENDW